MIVLFWLNKNCSRKIQSQEQKGWGKVQCAQSALLIWFRGYDNISWVQYSNIHSIPEAPSSLFQKRKATFSFTPSHYQHDVMWRVKRITPFIGKSVQAFGIIHEFITDVFFFFILSFYCPHYCGNLFKEVCCKFIFSF